MAELSQDVLWAALEGLPRPVTKDSALVCSRTVLKGKPLSDFANWLDTHELYLLQRLNG